MNWINDQAPGLLQKRIMKHKNVLEPKTEPFYSKETIWHDPTTRQSMTYLNTQQESVLHLCRFFILHML